MFKLDDIIEAPPAAYEWLVSQFGKNTHVQAPSDPNFKPGSERAHAWCAAYTDRLIRENRLPFDGNRNTWATAFYISMFTHGATEAFARDMHERVYEAGGARPDHSPDKGIEDIIERTWDGRMKCNPAGSELPRLLSEKFGPAAERITLRSTSPIHLQWGSESKVETQDWLWDGWLARGVLELIAGDPGCGKSTLALDMLATITAGGYWPDGTQAPRGKVLVWSTEDDWNRVLLPRFLASGGNPERIAYLSTVDDDASDEERGFHPARDMHRLHKTAELIPDLMAVMIDPIVSLVSKDSHENAVVRSKLEPLVEFAVRRQVTALGISHFTKGSMGGDPIHRVTGSLAFGAQARVVLAAAKNEEGDRRIIVRAKSNLGPDTGGFEYALVQTDEGHSHVKWGDVRTGTAKSLLEELRPPKKKAGRPDDKLRDCILWLRAFLLSQPGLRANLRDIHTWAAAEGYSEGTLRAARYECDDISTVPARGDKGVAWVLGNATDAPKLTITS